MSIGKQFLIYAVCYAASALIIEVFLWYFNPSLNEYLRAAITTSPGLISIVLTRVIVNKFKMKQDD